MTEAPSRRNDHRAKIVEVAARLLREHGAAAVTTRGVAEEAGVQAPAIYRLFGDKDGLLDAVAEHVMATFVAAKAARVEEVSAANTDALEDLRAGWETQIDFGLTNPSLFRLLSDPDRVLHSPSARSGRRVLEARVHRVALTGRLRVSENRAVGIIQAAGIGTIQLLLTTPPEQRDEGLAGSMYEAVLRQILTDAPAPPENGPLATTVAFRAVAPQLGMLSDAEQRLLGEWLDRAVEGLGSLSQP
ncbi:TetR/AcrR family transcriptional regulator [Kineosporia sp. NBRC 101731]|uniref:TetR/AcrR family transcriptional regulator n=1 Tax=Kineosporia sp. NBRC 101731 TaxID=3032199 RepID=UPI0024A426DD|nr:TetR/AcrR family transcriptional regulator [Kineosporia sp. NBRC 101731]GLY30475.1 TetR family transcriptional regulator [Kineosporia sp. NBRC 101731]